MATSQDQLSLSYLERDGVKYSGYTDTSSSVHKINDFRLASCLNAKKHVPFVPGYPRCCSISHEYDLVCLFAWNPPHLGCSCEDHQSSVHSVSKYYALEYQIQHIEIDHPESQVTIKIVYFGPLNRCTLILDNRKEHLFRVRCTNDGMNFGPFCGVFPITHNDLDLESIPLDVLYEDNEKESTLKPRDNEKGSTPEPRDDENESPLKPGDNEKGSTPEPKDDEKGSSPKPKEDQNAGKDDGGKDNKKGTSACGSPSTSLASPMIKLISSVISACGSSPARLTQHQSSTSRTSPIIKLTSSVISMISTDPFIWSPKDMLFVPSKNYEPDLQLAKECPKALFAIMPATPNSSDDHEDPITPTEAEEILKEIDPHFQSILDDAMKQKDNQPLEEQISSTSSSFHELSSYISDTSTHRSVSSATLSTLAACSWPFTVPYYEKYRSILAQMIKDSPLCGEESK